MLTMLTGKTKNVQIDFCHYTLSVRALQLFHPLDLLCSERQLCYHYFYCVEPKTNVMAWQLLNSWACVQVSWTQHQTVMMA